MLTCQLELQFNFIILYMAVLTISSPLATPFKRSMDAQDCIVLRSNISPAELLEIISVSIFEWQDTSLRLGNGHSPQIQTDRLGHTPFSIILQPVKTIAVKSWRLPLEVKPQLVKNIFSSSPFSLSPQFYTVYLDIQREHGSLIWAFLNSNVLQKLTFFFKSWFALVYCCTVPTCNILFVVMEALLQAQCQEHPLPPALPQPPT